MNAEEINITIAESLGWKFNQQHPWVTEECCNVVISPDGDWATFAPDYHGSLDACVEFEEATRNNQFHYVDYPRELFKLVTGRDWNDNVGYFLHESVTITAPQRCEAYLRTINKWTDS